MASIIKIGDKWRAQVRRRGYPAQTQTFATKAMAERWARGIESDIDAGRAGSGPVSMSMGAAVERYLCDGQKAKPFGRNKVCVLGYIRASMGGERLDDIRADRIVRYITEERRVSGPTAAIDLAYLKSVLRYAKTIMRLSVRTDVVDEAREVLQHMHMMQRSRERDRRPTPDELERIKGWLREHSDSLTPDHIDFLVATAMRAGEVTRIRWEDVSERDRTVIIRDRKHPRRKIGNDQTVPLLADAWAIVQRQSRTNSRIFPANVKTWSSIFPRACTALGIVDLRLHDLRHEGISRLVEGGKYSIPELMLISGHTDPKMLMRYTNLRAVDLHR